MRMNTVRKIIALVPCLLLISASASSAATIMIPRTRQDTCYNADGVIVKCANTGQDGDKQIGAPWPAARFADNADGTVSDNLTGLIWLRNANCTETVGGIARDNGLLDWQSSLTWCNKLGSGKCGLTDNSVAGDWRLPNINELRSLIDYSSHDPALPGGYPFTNVQSIWYWSSTTNPVYTAGAYNVGLSRESIHVNRKLYSAPGTSRVGTKTSSYLGVWPVRGGQSPKDRQAVVKARPAP
jgi:hypothetical protein